MKSSQIISHIINLPKNKKLKSINETNSVLKSLMGNKYNALIKYAYQKQIEGKTYLIIIAAHPAAKLEFKHDSRKSSLKLITKYYIQHNPNTSLKVPDEIQIFVQKMSGLSKKPMYEIYKPDHYKEKSKGEFENLAKDEKIHEGFEDIRKLILKNVKR